MSDIDAAVTSASAMSSRLEKSLDDLIRENKKQKPSGSGAQKKDGGGIKKQQKTRKNTGANTSGKGSERKWEHDKASSSSLEALRSQLRSSRSGTGSSSAAPVAAAAPTTGRSGGRSQQAKLLVSNLRETVSSDALRTIFSGVGKVVNVQLQLDPQGRSLGTAEVIMASEHEAQLAVTAFDNVNVDKQRLRVVHITSRAPAAKAAPAGAATTSSPTQAPRGKKAAAPQRSETSSSSSKKQSGGDSAKPAARGGKQSTGSGSGGVQKQQKTQQKPAAKPVKKGPKSVEDLDREIEQFMQK